MTDTAAKITDLREKLLAHRMEQELRVLTRHSRWADLEGRRVAPLSEAWGDLVDPHGYRFDEPGDAYDRMYGGGYMYGTGHRKGGANEPIFRTDSQLAEIRNTARLLFDISATAKAAVKNLRNYCIASGFDYAAKDRRFPGQPVAKNQRLSPVAIRSQMLIDELLDENDWAEKREPELFRRRRRDGEYFLVLTHVGGGHTQVRIAEPEMLYEPQEQPPPGSCWTFGIDTEPLDTERVYGYLMDWGGDDRMQYVPAASVEHVKDNVDCNVKRGISDFYPVFEHLRLAGKVLRNTAEGAAIQAAIAYIRQHTTGTTLGQIEQLRSNDDWATFDQPTATEGPKTQHQARAVPGTVLDAVGFEHVPGPMGTERGPNFILVEQAILRIIGTLWCMPEAMISGDASNANLASSLVAEAPWVRFCEAMQVEMARSYERVLWKHLHIAHQAGRFVDLSASWPAVRKTIRLHIEGPRVSSRNALEETQRREILSQNGLLSDETWSTQEELDREQEVANGVREPATGEQFAAAAQTQRLRADRFGRANGHMFGQGVRSV